jgi:ParB family transcriptional regulator, chromosome partitioning protein
VSTKIPKLGRGLEALIPKTFLSSGRSIINIPVGEIVANEYQPREHFDDNAIAQLAASITKYGVCQPILVRRKGNHYELVAGERRFRASILAGQSTIPAIIKNVSDKEALQLALIENLQREDLNCLEVGRGYARLIDEFDISHAELAEIFGKSRSAITNTLRLLNLPEFVKKEIINGSLTEGHARTLLSLDSDDLLAKILERVKTDKLNVRETEKIVASKDRAVSLKKIFHSFINKLTKKYTAKIKISGKEHKGKIEIFYKSKDDFNRIFSLLTQEE